MRKFDKPEKNNQELIEEWERRGLEIPDRQRAERYLEFISYYRLSAYTIPFQKIGEHTFKSGTSFDDILMLYVFDRELRLLVMDAVERIEVAVRAQICNVHSLELGRDGDSYGAFWYLDGRHFSRKFAHFRLLANIEKQLLDEKVRLDRDINNINKRERVSLETKQVLIGNAQKDNFIRHYVSQYEEPKLPPCWMMVEMLTWGELSHLYAGLKSSAIKKKIAVNLGVNAEILESWLKALNSIRNICAHHGRLWNKELGVAIKIPKSDAIRWLSLELEDNVRFERRIYSILVALQTILYKISPHSAWAKRLRRLLKKYPNIPRSNMGMPENWESDNFWKDAFGKDEPCTYTYECQCEMIDDKYRMTLKNIKKSSSFYRS